MEKLFQYRFAGQGDLAGHSFGNLFIAAMTQVVGDVELALQESCKVLAVRGQVLPSSTSSVRLSAECTDGAIINGESNIPFSGKPIRRVMLEPADVPAVKKALDAIRYADAVILGPGSLYTSVIPNLLVKEIAEALRRTKAIKMYVCNVMTQPGETDSYKASDHVRALLEHVGQGIVDSVIVNVQEVAGCLLDNYARQGACPVEADLEAVELLGVKVISSQVVSETNWVRHDSARLAKLVFSMIERSREPSLKIEKTEALSELKQIE